MMDFSNMTEIVLTVMFNPNTAETSQIFNKVYG